jgi:hypothetical protein
MYIVPDLMCVPNSDLSPVREGIDKIINTLTTWKPKTTAKGVNKPLPITVAGKDYKEALTNTTNLFLRNMWTDGLPIEPPTQEKVNSMLSGTPLAAETVIGKIMPQAGLATVETIAACLAMAGGRPEYMPVLISAVDAMCHTDFMHHFLNTTTGNPMPCVVVNGPMAEQIRLNCQYGCMGVNPLYPAGGSIGRALRFVLQITGGGVAGISSMSEQGSGRLTNYVFAEDETHLKGTPGWPTLAEDQGFAAGTNLVSVVPCAQTDFIMASTVSTVASADRCIRDYSWAVGVKTSMPPASFKYGLPYQKPLYTEKGVNAFYGMMIICPKTARGFASVGYTKEDFRKKTWLAGALPWDFVSTTWGTTVEARKWAVDNSNGVYVEGKPWPVSFTPKPIWIAVSGGEQADHAMYIMAGGASGWTGVSKEMKLPATAQWNKLLAQAETELGPIPAKTYV